MSIGTMNMRIKQAKTEGDKKKKRAENALTNAKGTFASSEKRPVIPTVEEVVAEQMRSATKPTMEQRVTNIGTRVGGAIPYDLMNAKEKDARDTELLHATATSPRFRVASGVAAGLSPVGNFKPQNEKQKAVQDIRNNSTGYKAGKVVGEIGSFAIPYAGAAGKVGKAAAKIPAVAKMGKVGQNVVKSLATDTVIGAPLNVNYAFNKEGLRGKEAAKSIAINSALDLGIGAGMELAGPAIKKAAKDLSERLGRKVTEKEAKEMLEANAKGQPAFTREELARKLMAHDANISEEEADKLLRQLAEDSNRRKGKTDIGYKTLYGNSPTIATAELPAPAGDYTVLHQFEGASTTAVNKRNAKSAEKLSKDIEMAAKRQYNPLLEKGASATSQMMYHIGEFDGADSVVNIEKPMFKMGKGLVEDVATFFKNIGGRVDRKGFGEVLLTKKGVRSSIGHGLGPEKASAFQAVPDVIRFGKQIGFEQNWKNRNYDTYLFAAPVNIGGKRHIQGVIVKKDKNSNRYYLHEVIEDLKTKSEGGSTTPLKRGDSGHSSLSSLNINPLAKNVNTSGQKIPTVEEMVKAQMEAAGMKPVAEGSVPTLAEVVKEQAEKTGKIPRVEEAVEMQMAKAGRKKSKGKTLKEMGALGKLYTGLVDNLHPVARADEGAKILTSNMRKSQGTADYIAKNGMVDMAGKDVSLKRADGSNVSLVKTFEDAAKIDLDAFNDYLLHRHNISRAHEGKNVFNDVPLQESRKKVEELLELHPEFKQLGDEISAMNTQLIDDWLVESGLISKDLGERLKTMYPNYVPTYREGIVRGEGFNSRTIKANKMVHEATGGNKPVIAPNISIAAQLRKTVRAARMNEIALQLKNAIKANPEKLKNVARFADESNPVKYADTMIKNSENMLSAQGLDGIDNMTKDLIGQDQVSGDFFLVAMDHGKPTRMIVNKDIFDALQTLNKVQDDEVASKIFNFMSDAMTKPFKSVVTGYNPFFGIRNILRDIPTAYIQGTEHNPLRFITNQAHAYHDILTDAELWKRYQAMGGKQGNYFSTQGGFAADKGAMGEARNFMQKILDGVAFFNETTEAATRYAEFYGTLKRAGKLSDPMYEDLQRALYNSGEATVNFGRFGDVTKAVDKVVPYLNPAVQGIDKFLRTMATSPAAYAKGFAALTIPSIGLYEYNQRFHKEDYDMLDDRTKDNYYCFYKPGSDGEWIKIPKSREAGVLFQTLAERMLRYANGDENAFKGFGNTVATNFAPQNFVENNIFSPVVYNLPRNKDFADRTIVPQRLEGYRKNEQYDEKTSEIAKWIGNAAAQLGINDGEGLSPKQIDYLIDSYTGIIGDIIIPATTQGGDVLKKVVTGPFTADNVYNNSIQNDFYEQMEKAEKEKNHVNLGEGIESDWKTPEEYRYSVYTKASKEMGELRKLERRYQTLPNSEMKTLYLRELRKEINAIAETATREADRLTKEYQQSYVPEISDMSDKRQSYYRDNLKGLGVDPAKLRQAYDEMDTNGSGSISQDEAYAVLEQTGFSREEKAAIWNFINSGWKKNPYL